MSITVRLARYLRFTQPGLVLSALVAIGMALGIGLPGAGSAAAQGAPATSTISASSQCTPLDVEISASEGIRAGTVTLEVAATVTRPCTIGTISASFIDASSQPVPGAAETQVSLDRTIQTPGTHVIATLVWDNWCGEHGARPEGVTIMVDGSTLVVPRFASQPFCRDREAQLALKVELAPEPNPSPRPPDAGAGLAASGGRAGTEPAVLVASLSAAAAFAGGGLLTARSRARDRCHW